MAKNTQTGNPREGLDYKVKKLANGIRQHIYKGRKPVTVKPPKPKKSKVAAPKTSAAKAPSGDWYRGDLQAQQNSIANAMKDPLKPTTGKDALAFAKALQATQIAPVLQQFDRQQNLVEGRGRETLARVNHAGSSMQSLIGQQIAEHGQAQNQSRLNIQAAGQDAQQRLAQHWAAADRAAAQDAEVRGAGLDAGQAAQRAQELANARARGERDTQIAVQDQLGGQQAGDALLRQIAAATAQQQGERQGQTEAATSTALRDLNEQRGKALTDAQAGLVNTLLTLQQRNTESALGQAAVRGDMFEAELKARTAKEEAVAKKAESKANRDLRMRIARLQSETSSSNQAKRLAAQQQLAELRETAAGRRAEEKLVQAQKKDAAKKKDKRMAFIVDVDSKATDATIRAEVLTPKNKDPRKINQQLANRGVKDPLTRKLIVDRHVHGAPQPDTVRMYRQKYGANPPKRWTTKKG